MAENKKALKDSELDTINGGRLLSINEKESTGFTGRLTESLFKGKPTLRERLSGLRNRNNSMVSDRQMSEEDVEQIASLVKDKFKGQL